MFDVLLVNGPFLPHALDMVLNSVLNQQKSTRSVPELYTVKQSGRLGPLERLAWSLHPVQSPKELMASESIFADDKYIMDKWTDEVKDSRRKRVLKRSVPVTLAINA